MKDTMANVENAQNSHPSNGLVKKLYGVPNERGGTTWLDKCPDYMSKSSTRSPDQALVLRYKEDRSDDYPKKSLRLCSITIQSAYLKQIIRDLFKRYPGETTDGEDLTFEAPFHPFFHQWATLKSQLKLAKQDAKGLPDQIETLMNVLEEELGDDMRDAQSLTQNGNVTFRLLWTLFPPGCPVFAQWKNNMHCLLVNEAKYLMAEVVPTLALELLLLDCDGERYGWRKISVFVPAFDGSMKVIALSAVPLHFHEDASGLLKILNARGVLAVDATRRSPLYTAYEGLVRLHRSFDFEEVEVFVEGRIVVDVKNHSRHASRYSPAISAKPHRLECMLSRDLDTKVVTMHKGGDLESQGLLSVLDNLNKHPVLGKGQMMKEAILTSADAIDTSHLKRHRWTENIFGISPETFCRSAVRGFCLTSKSWAEFEVDNITQIQWNHHAFDALVIPAPRKRLLEALVKQQQRSKTDPEFDDVVRGKGQGLIMLLSGPPGTGKTLTAESIADRLQLPLYAVSASELGDTAKEIEGHFGHILRLAAEWNAVLLLDEADAFLEKRVDTPEAVDRNKRVAAFLRILEYYRGILILTTNRIVNFDDAFYSRIHLSLPFKPLDQTSRERIWSNFLRGTDLRAPDLELFASENLNGRQIKNIMKMARLLAKDDGLPLNSHHIRDVLMVVKDNFDSQPLN